MGDTGRPSPPPGLSCVAVIVPLEPKKSSMMQVFEHCHGFGFAGHSFHAMVSGGGFVVATKMEVPRLGETEREQTFYFSQIFFLAAQIDEEGWRERRGISLCDEFSRTRSR
jgi:hypothetical protein